MGRDGEEVAGIQEDCTPSALLTNAMEEEMIILNAVNNRYTCL